MPEIYFSHKDTKYFSNNLLLKGKKSAAIYTKGKTNMTSLNLPPFDVRLRGTKQAPLIFDFLRRRYVRLTPEEWVRQHFVHFMVEHRHYPASLLANEVSLHVGDKVLRADTILYNKQLQPVMIVEYKAPHIPVTQTVFDQIATYNLLLHVGYLVVSNGLQHYVCKMDYESKKYLYLEELPDYSNILTK